MDDLVHHILRELSFDGDLGCSVSRLEDFINEFYHKNVAQTVDDGYCAFVWSVIVQEPTVRVGVLPTGEHAEVYVAPQRSAQKKAKKKGEEVVEDTVVALSIVPDATIRGLDQLKAEYGDSLRIAVDPETSFAAITGSHIRPSKLTPMVYTALQLITRGRERGISVVELGRKTQYDQKTCFYLVKQLETLDLVIKIRRAGVGTHFCMHKHFYERSVFWKSVREEGVVENVVPQNEDDEREESQPSSKVLQFDPIDSRHLSSLPLLRGRITKLLNHSTNHMHASQNLLITLGFEHPTRTDRRFFSVRLAELVKEGTIEKVLVPNSNTKRYPNGKVQCIRLVDMDDREKQDQEKEGVVVVPAHTDDEGDEPDDNDAAESKESFHLKSNIVIHRQIIDLLGNAGARGMTLSEISQQLCNFDRRTVELLLQRLEKDPPPPHLRDLGVAVVTETHGRERRHRYYTYGSYRSLLERENLVDSDGAYSSVDLSNVGGFLPVSSDQFYGSEAQLVKYQDTFRDHENKQKGRKHKTTNPILEDGTVKKGRPRKDGSSQAPKKTASTAGERKSKKRKQVKGGDDDGDAMGDSPSKKMKKAENPTDPPPAIDKIQFVIKKRGSFSKSSNGLIQEKPPLKARGPPFKGPSSCSASVQEQTGISGLDILHDSSMNETSVAATADNFTGSIDPNISGIPSTRPRVNPSEIFISQASPEPPFRVDVAVPELRTLPMPSDNAVAPLGSGSPKRVLDPINPESRPPSIQGGSEEQSPTTLATHAPTPAPAHQESEDAFVDHTVVVTLNASGKRPQVEPPAPMPPAKRSKRLRSSESGPRKTNVSHLRRDNELFRVIQDFGGITVVNVKEFLDAHMGLIETLTKAGEQTSAPTGTRLDRRTVDAAMQKLESDCRIKVIKTSTFTTTGISRPVTIAHVFDMEQEKVNSFVSDLGKNGSFGYVPSKIRQLSPGIEYGSGSAGRPSVPGSPSKALQLDQAGDGDKEKWGKNVPRATQLFAYDDATIQDILQREHTTISQSYGYIMGKIARARKLHLLVLDHLQRGVNCPRMVSADQRIVHLTYFLRDIPVSAYCSLISTQARIEELDRLQETEEGGQTLLSDLPKGIYVGLGIGTAKSRSRLLDLLEVLCALKLATPVQPLSGTPWITCGENGTNPTTYDMVSSASWTSTSSATAPVYWKVEPTAPINLWVLSETTPPLWKDMVVSSHDDGVMFWNDLRKACLDSKFANDLEIPIGPGIAKASEEPTTIGRSLRRDTSWKSSYMLSWYQTRYLRQFTDSNPLSDEDGGMARIKHASWVISAPEQVVQQFYIECRERLTRELEKVRRRVERKDQPAKAKTDKKSLAKKAAERKLQRQQDWDHLVARLHPTPVKKPLSSRLKRIRGEYLQATSVRESQKWELDITEAIRETNLATSKALPTSRPSFAPIPSVAPGSIQLPTVAASEKGVDELIAQQGPSQRSTDSAKRKISDDEENSQKKRRGRFSWTRDYDELAKDASAIIKARCRSGQRMEWAAAEQLFPGLARNSVRQRVDRLAKEPGVESYLHRLEDKWYNLWTQHRGTALLPDPDPSSVSNFDLVKHLKFLRAHIDKASLRVGFPQTDVELDVQIPSTVEHLLNSCDIIEKGPVAPPWDFVWSAVTEEGREKQMFSQALVVNDERLFSSSTYEEDRFYVADATVKMVLGTPNESYDFEMGAALLRPIGEEAVSKTTLDLLNRGVLSKLVRDPLKVKPGRTLKISETNLNAIGGSLSHEIFQDASSLEELSMEEQPTEREWRDWPLLASDGDMAALIELVSEDKVDFDIDTSHARAARLAIEWNSKKADDDDIETGIQIHVRDLCWTDMWPEPEESPPSRILARSEPQGNSAHAKTGAYEPACCRRDSTGVVDCQGCLDEARVAFTNLQDDRGAEVVKRLTNCLNDAGPAGIPKASILPRTNPPDEVEIFPIIQKMCQHSIPLVFWTGYLSTVLVSATNVRPWTVVTSESPLTRIFPRRWMDINGVKMIDIWEAGLRAVIGIIIFRPGIRQCELRWRLRAVYDRSEINDLLRHLEDENFIVRRLDSHLPLAAYGCLDDREEMGSWLFLGSRHWYHV